MTQHFDVSNAAWLALDVMAEKWAPPPPVDYLRWAEDNISFSKRESPDFPGPYNRDRFGYFDQVLRALSPEDPCRIVTLKKSAQLGGTVLANIFTCGTLDMDPGDFLYVHPTDENARRWSKMKLAPMLQNNTALARIFPMRSRDGLDSVLYKERKDKRGAIQISGANSPAQLSQVTMARQVQDDLAKWEMNAAGDPETQADSRSRGIDFAKIFKISTPMVVPGCRITKNFEAGSQEYLEVPCPHEECGHFQTLDWENMQATLDEQHPERAHFTCVACKKPIEEHHRAQMLRGSRWVARNPDAKRYHRSFYIWSAYSFLQRFETIAREWLAAKGDPASEQTFMNDALGLAYQARGEAPSWEVLRDRAADSEYERGNIPAGYPVLTCGVDCQGDRVEWQVVAWGRERRRAVIDYGRFDGHISDAGCQKLLHGLLQQGYRNAYGRKIEIDMMAVDGNAYTEDVWDFVGRYSARRVIMVRGVHPETAPLIALVKKEYDRRGKRRSYSRRFYNFASSVMKMGLYRNVKKTDPAERGYVGLPRGLEDEFYRQLTSESRKPVRTKSGFIRYLWIKDDNQANEGLDTHMQAEAAANLFGVRHLPDTEWDRLFAKRECAPEEVQGDMEELWMRGKPSADERAADARAAAPAKDAPNPAQRANAWGNRLR